MSDIPKARQRLMELSERIRSEGMAREAGEIEIIVRLLMTRKPVARRAPNHSQRMSPILAAAILNYAEDHPDASQAAISRRFDVNIGRVSEVLSSAQILHSK